MAQRHMCPSLGALRRSLAADVPTCPARALHGSTRRLEEQSPSGAAPGTHHPSPTLSPSLTMAQRPLHVRPAPRRPSARSPTFRPAVPPPSVVLPAARLAHAEPPNPPPAPKTRPLAHRTALTFAWAAPLPPPPAVLPLPAPR